MVNPWLGVLLPSSHFFRWNTLFPLRSPKIVTVISLQLRETIPLCHPIQNHSEIHKPFPKSRFSDDSSFPSLPLDLTDSRSSCHFSLNTNSDLWFPAPGPWGSLLPTTVPHRCLTRPPPPSISSLCSPRPLTGRGARALWSSGNCHFLRETGNQKKATAIS